MLSIRSFILLILVYVSYVLINEKPDIVQKNPNHPTLFIKVAIPPDERDATTFYKNKEIY